ncbi:MAG: ATP-binding protein, partial [Bacteroidota bacterium]
IRYFIKICEDITAIKEEEENLRRTRDKAIESADLKNRFLANMSHEIRAPLNAIIGFSEMIANRELSAEKKKEFVRIITGNGNNLIKIIDDIIDIAQIEANQLKIQLEPRYPSVLIRELKAIYDVQKLSINKRHIRIIESIPADTENLQIMNDCVRMQQIMNNLISNALKYTENGSICIGYEMKETMIEFFVRDTGIGIAKENHDLIFEYYTRKPGPLEEKSSGTGLGLAISKGLVHLLGGEIRLKSEPGKGTEFRFTIPIREVNGEKVPVENADCNIGRTYEDKTILVVEDVDYNYELIEMMLEDLKAKILWAKNGREALQIFRENPVDLVLMDINLPDVNGIDTTKEIHKINAEIPVIAETAYAFTDELKKIMEAGFVDIIVKPIVTDKLVYLVKKYLR